MCRPGEAVELRPEPDNAVDPYAVAVYSCRGIQLGYVPAERCARINSMLGQGRDIAAVFQGYDQNRAYMRVAYDGEAPILPVPKQAPESDPDFWPDPIWDD